MYKRPPNKNIRRRSWERGGTIHYSKMEILEPAALQPREKRKALENVGINFYFGRSSSLAGCSVRGATDSVPQGQPSIPGRPRASKAVLQTLATGDAFPAVPILHTSVRRITIRTESIFVSFMFPISSHVAACTWRRQLIIVRNSVLCSKKVL